MRLTASYAGRSGSQNDVLGRAEAKRPDLNGAETPCAFVAGKRTLSFVNDPAHPTFQARERLFAFLHERLDVPLPATAVV